jgi:hypothetical protein
MAATWGRPDIANVGGRFHEGRVINTNARTTGMPVMVAQQEISNDRPERPDLNVDFPGRIV